MTLLKVAKIWKIITRYPNLECIFFAAFLEYFERIRRSLNITRGKIQWEFVSTACGNLLLEPGVTTFNTGGGDWDQHRKPENEVLSVESSLNMVRKEYDFIARRAWVQKVFALVSNNDVNGSRTSWQPYNLRELIAGLTVLYPDDPHLVLDWGILAVCGVFENIKSGMPEKKVFGPDALSSGVGKYDFDRLGWFNEIKTFAIEAVKRETVLAKEAVARAEKLNRFKSLVIPGVGRVNVIEVESDSVKAGPIARLNGYNVVVQINSSGHVQIHGGWIFLKNEKNEVTKKVKFHFGRLVRWLRLVESIFAGKPIAIYQNLEKAGNAQFEDGTDIPWFFPDFRSSVYNRTLSSPDVPVTKIRKDLIFAMVCKILSRSLLIVEEKGKQRIVVRRTSDEWITIN